MSSQFASMRPVPQVLSHCYIGGRPVTLWRAFTTSARTRHDQPSAGLPSAIASNITNAVDLIQWPEGTRPKRGGVTKAALSRLKVADLRAELERLGADANGSKDKLASRLLQLVTAAATANPYTAVAAVVSTSMQAPIVTGAAAAPQTATVTAAEDAIKPQKVQQIARLKQQTSDANPETAAGGAPQQTSASHIETAQSISCNNCSSSSNSTTSSHQQQQNIDSKQFYYAHQQIIHDGRMPPYDPVEAAAVAAAIGVDLDELPPLVQQQRGHVYEVAQLVGLNEAEQELVLKANRSGFALTLLGGAVGDAAAGDCSPPCLGLLRDKDIWLFDAGEDAQRSIMWREHLKPSKMHRIVITRQTPDAMLGLPGGLCVIGASREKGHENADIPVHVYGPEGTGDFLYTLYECSNTFLEMPVVVHEFVTYAVSEEQMQPQPLSRRAKLWRSLLPPDQLNPQGYTDGDLEVFMPTQGRARFKKGMRAAGGVLAKNPRAGYRPMCTPPPGDPTCTDLNPAHMTWTVVADEAAMMTAVMVDQDPPSWGIVFKEADKQGNLSVPRCEALGITNGEAYKLLKDGQSVPNDDGIAIPAFLVCSQDKPGRKLVLLPACSQAGNLRPHAVGADIMFGSAAAGADGSSSSSSGAGRQLGAGLGMYAQQWGVRHLVVTGMPGSGRSRSSSLQQPTSQDEADMQQQQHPSHRQQQQAGVASLLSVVAEQFTHGRATAGRDNVSFVVEENLGNIEPPPPDMEQKTVTMRAMLALDLAPSKQSQPQQHQLQQQQPLQQQQREHEYPVQRQQRQRQHSSIRSSDSRGQQRSAGGWQPDRYQQRRWQQNGDARPQGDRQQQWQQRDPATVGGSFRRP